MRRPTFSFCSQMGTCLLVCVYLALLFCLLNIALGAFVASAGLESFVTHGFMTPSEGTSRRGNDKLEHTAQFVRDNLTSYARAALPFVSDAHILVQEKVVPPTALASGEPIADALHGLRTLDNLYEAVTLNHVARRASKTQGVALLSLYSKGFTKPPVLRTSHETVNNLDDDKDLRLVTLFDRLKLSVRREETYGHLPICWGVLTAALGLSLGASTSSSTSAVLFRFTMLNNAFTSNHDTQNEASSCTCSSTLAD